MVKILELNLQKPGLFKQKISYHMESEWKYFIISFKASCFSLSSCSKSTARYTKLAYLLDCLYNLKYQSLDKLHHTIGRFEWFRVAPFDIGKLLESIKANDESFGKQFFHSAIINSPIDCEGTWTAYWLSIVRIGTEFRLRVKNKSKACDGLIWIWSKYEIERYCCMYNNRCIFWDFGFI